MKTFSAGALLLLPKTCQRGTGTSVIAAFSATLLAVGKR
jgi:hypothetical protein